MEEVAGIQEVPGTMLVTSGLDHQGDGEIMESLLACTLKDLPGSAGRIPGEVAWE